MAKQTIKEIAKIAGVSPSAVSIVLNNRTGVSDETRQKIAEIIEKLQYTPNPNSRRLLLNKTNNIAVLFKKNISPLEHLFHSELNRIILLECETLGYNLIFTSTSIHNDNVLLPNIIKSYDVDGIIFYGDVDPIIINSINKFDIPYIIVDSHIVDINTLSVSADYMESAYTATNYLIKLGHSKVAYIGNSLLFHYNNQTFAGFKKAIEENKIIMPINWLQFDANNEQTAYHSMENILSYEQLPTAVFCSADIYAIGAIKCIKDHNLRIPDDISVIGIDDIILSQYIEPPLTTVKIDKAEMGRIAIEMLIKKIDKLNVENQVVASKNLILRSSTKELK